MQPQRGLANDQGTKGPSRDMKEYGAPLSRNFISKTTGNPFFYARRDALRVRVKGLAEGRGKQHIACKGDGLGVAYRLGDEHCSLQRRLNIACESGRHGERRDRVRR